MKVCNQQRAGCLSLSKDFLNSHTKLFTLRIPSGNSMYLNIFKFSIQKCSSNILVMTMQKFWHLQDALSVVGSNNYNVIIYVLYTHVLLIAIWHNLQLNRVILTHFIHSFIHYVRNFRQVHMYTVVIVTFFSYMYTV